MTTIFVLGNATVDFVFRVNAWPRIGESVLADGFVHSAGGKGLNQAVAASRLGARVRLTASLGSDENASFVQASITDEDILSISWLRREHLITDVSVIWSVQTGENKIVSSAECACSVSSEEATQALAQIESGDLLLMQGNLSAETTAAALAYARGKNARSILNTAPITWDMSPILGQCDLIVCNQPEFEALAIATPGFPNASFANRPNQCVIVTRGDQGAWLITKTGREAFSSRRAKLVDSAGAGDMLTGALAALLSRGVSIRDALTQAMRLAARTVEKTGTFTSFPAAAEIPDFIDTDS